MTAAQSRNVGGAVALLIIAAGCLCVGLHALLHPERCGEQVMHAADQCPNRSSRTGHTWVNDADQQHARNHRVGVAMLLTATGFVLASGVVYRYTGSAARPAPS